MKNSIKTLLKTSAALGAIAFGSTTWAGNFETLDGTDWGGDYNVETFALFTPDKGGAISVGHAITATKPGAVVVIGSNNENTIALAGTLTATKDSKWYLGSGDTLLDLGAATFTGPTSGTAKILLPGGGAPVELPAGIDQTKFVLSVLSATAQLDFGGAVTLSMPVDIPENMQVSLEATNITAISSPLTGLGTIVLSDDVDGVSSDLSKFKGTLVLGNTTAAIVISSDLSKFPGALQTGEDLDFSAYARNQKLKLPQQLVINGTNTVTTGISGDKMKKVTMAGASTLIANEDLTIDELDLTGNSGAVTFQPAAGKKITIKKLTGATDADLNIIVNAAGELVLPKLTGFAGTVTTTLGTVSYK